MARKISGIYQILNTVNGDYYIGSAANIRNRISSHKSYLRNNKHYNQFLQRVWNKYGPDAFEFRVVGTCDPDKLLVIEDYMLKDLCPTYNLARDAFRPALGMRWPGKGRGRIFTEEHKRKLSEAAAGRTLSEKQKDNLRKARVGMLHTEETKMKMSKAHAGKTFTKEHRDNISKGLMGRKLSEEHRDKTRQAGILGAHNRWHKDQTNKSPDCEYCQ